MPTGVKAPPEDRYQIGYLSLRHRAVLEWLLLNPFATLKECAQATGHSYAWICMLVNTDLFQEEYERRSEGNYQTNVIPLRQKLMGVGHVAVEKLASAVENSDDPEFLLAAADRTLQRLGYGNTRGPSVTIEARSTTQNVFVVDNATLSSARAKLAALRNDSTPAIEGETPTALPSPD